MSRVRNLSSAVVESLKHKELVSELETMLLTKDRTKILRKDETEYWDYKDSPNLGDPSSIAKLAKRILAFHNAKGGALIHGVDSRTFAVTGVQAEEIIDSVDLNNRLRKYIGTSFSVFQDRIELANGRAIWLIFAPRRSGSPIPMQANGPADSRGNLPFKRNEYYVRVGDESKVCSEPLDLERLFAGNTASHFQAYLYEVDEPYFRLLAPHCDDFIGRRKLIDEVKTLLNSRHPVISLDGVGGVGKSALAIELVKELYQERKYMFIVSLSAKSKVWIGHTGTRVAGFSGMTEFLREIARVLQVPFDEETSKLKSATVAAMKDFEGLILVDNIEDVEDPDVLRFISLEVPAPVKVLVTSRIDRGLGALAISVPEMDEAEALQLLSYELKRVNFAISSEEVSIQDEIIRATGRLPLALKWACSMAASSGSLREVSRRLRTMDSTKKEFLNFCFKTMFDELSDLAQSVATLSTYLAHEWNVPTLAIALDKSESEIERGVKELQERGVILATVGHRNEQMRLLPLTLDFLSNRWHENAALSNAVLKRLADAIGSGTDDKLLTNWPTNKRIDFLVKRVTSLRDENDLVKAKKLVRVADSWTGKVRNCELAFLEAQLAYLSGEKMAGLAGMKEAFEVADPEKMYIEEKAFLADALLRDGLKKDEMLVVELCADVIPFKDGLSAALINRFVRIAVDTDQIECLRTACVDLKSPLYGHVIAKALQEEMHKDPTLPFKIGMSLLNLFSTALKYPETTPIERQRLQRQHTEYSSKLSANKRGS